jgi:hypothetical protein
MPYGFESLRHVFFTDPVFFMDPHLRRLRFSWNLHGAFGFQVEWLTALVLNPEIGARLAYPR